jgi:uncharacterized protein with HEPN domain
MQRDILLLTEMIDAAEQAQHLVIDVSVSQLEANRERRDALLWNFTVLGEAPVNGRPADTQAKACGLAWSVDLPTVGQVVS